MKKKLTAFFLSVVLFGALNTAHCVEPSSSGSSPAEGEEKQLTNAQADKAYQPHTQGQYISGSVKDEEKAGSQQKQLPDNQTDKATQDQLMNDRSNVIQLNLSAPDSPIERNHLANTQINNRDQIQQENQYISGSGKGEEKASSQQDQLPDNQTDKATQDQLMDDRIQFDLSAPDYSPIEQKHLANTQTNNWDQKQQQNQYISGSGNGDEKAGSQQNHLADAQTNNRYQRPQQKHLANTQTNNRYQRPQQKQLPDAQTNNWDQIQQENSTYKMITPSGDTIKDIANKVAKLLHKIESPNINYNKIYNIKKFIRDGFQVNMYQGGYAEIHRHMRLEEQPNAILHISLPGECSQREHYKLNLKGKFKVYTDGKNSGLQIDVNNSHKLRVGKLHINVLQWLNKDDAETLRKTLIEEPVYMTIRVDGPPQCMTKFPSKHFPPTYVSSNHQKNVANKY